jgi:dihydroorotase
MTDKQSAFINMSGRPELLVRNGHLIDPAAGVDSDCDILIADGVVADIAPAGKLQADGIETIDAAGLIVAPGFIDLHVHLREPGQTYKETIASGTAAAAAGGFTSVCAMPNTSPVNDNADLTDWMQAPQRDAKVNVFPVAAATNASQGRALTDFRSLREAGAIGVTDDGKPILENELMRSALRDAAAVGFPVMQHAEDTTLTANAYMNAGPVAFRLGLRGMPADAETRIVERDIRLAAETGAHLHVCHISVGAAVNAVREAKKRGVHVTCEVTPHHFTLTDEEVERHPYDTNYKMKPPLRSVADRMAVIEGILDGTIDAIATDHAPHAAWEKSVEFDRAAVGVIGLETALGLAISELHVKHNVPLKRIVELFAPGPAGVIGLLPTPGIARRPHAPHRGTLAKGAYADMTIFDPKAKWTFNVDKSCSLSRNTPFNGWELTGKVVATILAGEVAYRAE